MVGDPRLAELKARLEQITARVEKATKGPWRSMSKGNDTMENGLLAAVAEVEGLPRPWNPVWIGWQSAKNYFKTFLRKEDADFIAHAREDIPFLLSEIDRLREAADALSPRRIMVDRDADLRIELRAWLDTQTITSDNIGDIRRSLFMPWDSPWNGWVRDETAKRENQAESAALSPHVHTETKKEENDAR